MKLCPVRVSILSRYTRFVSRREASRDRRRYPAVTFHRFAETFASLAERCCRKKYRISYSRCRAARDEVNLQVIPILACARARANIDKRSRCNYRRRVAAGSKISGLPLRLLPARTGMMPVSRLLARRVSGDFRSLRPAKWISKGRFRRPKMLRITNKRGGGDDRVFFIDAPRVV